VFSAPTWAIRRGVKPSGFQPEDHWFDSSMAYEGEYMSYYYEQGDHYYEIKDMDVVVSELNEKQLCVMTENAIITYKIHSGLAELVEAGFLVKETIGDGYEPSLEEFKATADVLREAVRSRYGEKPLRQIEKDVVDTFANRISVEKI
jgi:hypothetical protein